MTSKEAIVFLKEQNKLKRITLNNRKKEEAFEIIEKDLEILEILDAYLVYDEYEEEISMVKYMPLGLKEKIKEWLNR